MTKDVVVIKIYNVILNYCPGFRGENHSYT
jgi:hypothetical protein